MSITATTPNDKKTPANSLTCSACAYLIDSTSGPRPSEFALSHRAITLFHCARVPGVPWSHLSTICGSFVERAR